MSLISKQIEELRAYAADRKGELAKMVSDAADTIESLSEKLSAANMERSSQYYNGGWIPVTERLPEEDYCTGRGRQYSAHVLVTVINHGADGETFTDMAYTFDGEWQLTHPHDNDPDVPEWCEIIAWMPLPEPYEGENHDIHQIQAEDKIR